MNRAEQIEQAARALLDGCLFSMDERFTHAPAKALVDALRAALALPPDPPGECCRGAAERGIAVGYEGGLAHGTAAGRREGFWLGASAAAEIVNQARGEGPVDLRSLVARIRALPLPGAKEGA